MENKYLINNPISIEEINFSHVNDDIPRYGEGFDYNGEKSNWCAYVHINKQNQKTYFGITSDLKSRWKGHTGSQYKHCTAFYKAIQKYTWNGFEHIVLCNGLTAKMAQEIEIELIAKYKSNKKCGYNITDGGEGVTSLSGLDATNKKEVFAYNPDGTFYKSWPLLKYAVNEVGGKTPEVINKAIKGIQDMAYGYQWRDSYCGEKIDAIDPLKNMIYRNMPIVRISGDKQLTYYDDVYALEDKDLIFRIKYTFYSGKHNSCGYLWYFVEEFDENKINEYLKNDGLRYVYQYDMLGNLLNIFPSKQEASNYIGGQVENIAQCCERYNLSAYGYQWRYSFDIDDIGKYETRGRMVAKKYENIPIYEISPDKELLNIYSDVYHIFEDINLTNNIAQICMNKSNTRNHKYKGHYWFSEDEYLSGEYITCINNVENQKIICCYNEEGNLIAKYKNIEEAVIQTGIKRVNIINNLAKNVILTGGFQWRYEYEEAPGKVIPKPQNNGRDKKVAMLDMQTHEIIQIFDRIIDARSVIGDKDVSIITKVCKGKNKTAFGYIWRYLDSNNNIIEPEKEVI